MIIGVDFDNTVVSYDRLMYEIAFGKGWINEQTPANKKEIRDTIRSLPEGDLLWQKVQGIVYGSQMQQAELIEGVLEFFQICKIRNIPIYIISHKTEYANEDVTETNLREAALKWMKTHHFFDEQGLQLDQKDVFFESTRMEKINRIKALGCTHFIDDLEETFLELSFPSAIQKILYAPHQSFTVLKDVQLLSNWIDSEEILNHAKNTH